jgi:hypothetical protein
MKRFLQIFKFLFAQNITSYTETITKLAEKMYCELNGPAVSLSLEYNQLVIPSLGLRVENMLSRVVECY